MKVYMRGKRAGIMIIIVVVLATIILFSFCNKSQAVYSTADENGIQWVFTISGGKATELYYYRGQIEDTLKIPEKVKLGKYEYPVVSTRNSTRYNIFDTTKNYSIKKVILPDSLITIGKNSFLGFDNLKEIEFGNGIKTISDYAFSGTSIGGTITLPDSVTSISSYSFGNGNRYIKDVHIGSGITTQSDLNFLSNLNAIENVTISENNTSFCSIDGIIYDKEVKKIIYCPIKKEINNFVVPSTITTINDRVFYNRKLTGNLTLPDGLISIGNAAFYNTQISGTLVIPDFVTNIGGEAFYGCSKLTGLNMGSGITTIGNQAFFGCSSMTGSLDLGSNLTQIMYSTFNGTNFNKVVVGGKITEIGYNALRGVSDLWINKEEGSVALNNISENREIYIHWLNDTHKIVVNSIPGVKLINTATNEEITTGNFDCETEFKYKVVVEDGYNYSNLKIVDVLLEDIDNYKQFDYQKDGEYTFDQLIRDRAIYVQNISSNTDLALRIFATEVNRKAISTSRVPALKFNRANIGYAHTKYPVKVNTNDTVTLKVRVYNEGMKDAKASKISIYLPENVELVTNNKINTEYDWTCEGNKYTSTYLADKTIKKYLGNGDVKYLDVEILVKVTAQKFEDGASILKNIFAEIEEEDNRDVDSTCGNVDVSNTSSYKKEEIYNSNSNSIIEGQEDDDDFDTLVLLPKVKVDYNIKINMVDGETKVLLEGARFNLLDKEGNIIRTAETDENGVLDFKGLTTYDQGTDVYFIQEIETPQGYIVTEGKKIKVEVIKTIIDEEKGTYDVKVRCDTIDHTIDTSTYKFVPVKTIEQLQKIGSGETIEIDGINYEYNTNTNYKLMNDIDLHGIDWNPIVPHMDCVFDGNGHKISNLTILYQNREENKGVALTQGTGLFNSFSGIVENLELENVNINYNSSNVTSDTQIVGTGAFAGIMSGGYIVNCKASGSISTSVKNIGGFIGHTYDGMVRVDNCINNIEIEARNSANNVGGIVGCALGSISINNSTNNAIIKNTVYNKGGLVGYVKPSKYKDSSINGAFDDGILNLYVENTSTSGEYNVILQTIKGETLDLLPGARYTIYDENKNVIEGLDNIQLETGTLKLFNKEIKALGTDIYYIKENETIPNYPELSGIVRAEVERYWDKENSKYKVRVTTSVLTKEEFDNDTRIPGSGDIKTEKVFEEGEIFTETNISKANWNSAKAEFINCMNNGELQGGTTNSAGIVGASHGYTYIENCENTAAVSINGNSAGIIGELYAWENSDYVQIINCRNSGQIVSTNNSLDSAAGIAAHVMADIKVTKCTNTGEIASSRGSASGILGNAVGKIYIDSCRNEGTINTHDDASNCNCNAGGMLAKSLIQNVEVSKDYTIAPQREQVAITITNCENKGEINSISHFGGMVGVCEPLALTIESCDVGGLADVLPMIDNGSADKGGIVGFSNAPYVTIKNCNVDRVKISRLSSSANSGYGPTGGIIGDWTGSGNSGSTLVKLEILNCKVTNSDIDTKGQSTAGIIGTSYGQSGDSQVTITIQDCIVDNCNIKNYEIPGNTSYGSSGGIVAYCYGSATCTIDNCLVNSTIVESKAKEGSSGSGYNAGGISGCMSDVENIIITNNNVVNSNINLVAPSHNGYTDQASGFVGAVPNYGTEKIEFNNCKLLSTNVNTNAGNIGGYLAHTNSKGISLSNCKIKDCNIYSTGNAGANSVAGGMLGYTNYNAELKSCSIDNLDLKLICSEPYSSSNTGGFMAQSAQSAEIDSCNISNSSIYSTAAYGGTGPAVTGIVGSIMGNGLITNCNVTNTEINGPNAGNVAGILGDSSNVVTIRNCNVIESSISSQRDTTKYYGNSAVAGLASSVPGIVIENSKVQDCEITASARSIAGVVAGFSSSSNFKLKDITAKNISIVDNGRNVIGNDIGERAIGGIVGICGGLQADNLNADNINIISHSSSIGGIAGFANNPDYIKNSSINRLVVNNTSEMNQNSGSVAGLVGDLQNSGRACNIMDNVVTNSDITVENENTAGLIGTINGLVTIDKCTIDNVNLTNQNINGSNVGNAGGITAYCTDGVSILNSCVKNSTITIGSTEITKMIPKYVGGFVGFSNNLTISSSKVINTQINNGSPQITGGFVGMVNHSIDENTGNETTKTLMIDESSVEGETSITGNSHIGGILGFGKIIANNNTINDIAINTNTENSEVGVYVGGVVGVTEPESEINGVTASNVMINEEDNTSLIAGIMKGIISNINVKEGI